MKIALINPPLISQKNDPHTGIIFMPFMLAYLSSYLKNNGYKIQLVDAFGESPWTLKPFLNKMQIQGLPLDKIVEKIDEDTSVAFIYFSGVVAYAGIAQIVTLLKNRFPKILVVLVENSQAVTAFSVKHDAENLLNLGFDLLLYGEPELGAKLLLENIEKKLPYPEIDGFIFKKNEEVFYGKNIPFNEELDELPLPDWESFPLKNYWSIGYAHGPMEKPYLPLLTSRGCPVNCQFCVIPSTNNRRWRYRSPKNVVDEMEFFNKKLNITEFHIEDVNPTVMNKRIIDICHEIINRKLKIKWKFAAGTKIETLKLETIPLLAKAGCSYISFSPETGSPNLLKKMDKPFKHDLAYEMVKSMHKHKIYSQSCFVLGFPGETAEDIALTQQYIKKLTLAGLDEIAQFIITPIPGTGIFNQIDGYKDFSQLTFSPTWRKDYKILDKRRKLQYFHFLFWKSLRYPHKVIRQIINIGKGKFETKMEQAIFRITIWPILRWMKTRA